MSILRFSDSLSDSSDDIEIVENKTITSHSGNDICQLCSSSLHALSPKERNKHYNKYHAGGPHISSPASERGRPEPASAAIPQRKTAPMRFRKSSEGVAQEDVFWFPAQDSDPPDNYSPGVLSILKEALKHSHKKDITQRAVLCYDRTPHILRESFDMKWGCGYRNFMMTCAALMDQQFQTLYFPYLDDPTPPGVRNLQIWLEGAWKQGYDDIGARDLQHKLVDTKKQLGTGDLYVAFTSRRIPCALVDFDFQNVQKGKGFETLTEWVVNYFTEKPEGNVNKILRAATPVVATDKMPIIMQYDGHSVTIVGYELARNGKYNLLVFDPSSMVDKSIRQAALNGSTSGRVDIDWVPSTLGKSKRRNPSQSPLPKKRPRTNQEIDDEIVSVPDSDDEVANAHRAVALKSTLDADAVIKAFKLKPQQTKKQAYQLLYFTMDNLLSEEEQNDRKVVLSVVGC